jgi:hypothetical protein
LNVSWLEGFEAAAMTARHAVGFKVPRLGRTDGKHPSRSCANFAHPALKAAALRCRVTPAAGTRRADTHPTLSMSTSTSSLPVSSGRALRLAGLACLLGLGAAQSLAQAPAGDPNSGRRRGGDRPERTGQDAGGQDRGGRGNFSPEDMQARMLNGLRDRMGITNDEEWGLISQRIAAVSEARRATGGGLFGGMGGPGGRGGPPAGGGGDRGGRGPGGRSSSNPEMAALQQALADNLPEAEIKSRLDRMRDARRNNEAKVAKAQEDLRAVLTVKQEAVAVMFGLLP